jgi:hypothetical protein
LSATLDDGVAFRHGIGGVISAFGVDVRADLTNDGADIRLRKDDDDIDICECRDNLCPLCSGDPRASCTFQIADGLVGIDGDDQMIAERFRAVKVADVPDMKDIENTVCQDDGIATHAPCGHTPGEFYAADDLAGSSVQIASFIPEELPEVRRR